MTSKFIANQKHKYHIQKLILEDNKKQKYYQIHYKICARLPKTYMHGFREHMCTSSKKHMCGFREHMCMPSKNTSAFVGHLHHTSSFL